MPWADQSAAFLSVYDTGYGAQPDGQGLNPEDLRDVIEILDPWDNPAYLMLEQHEAISTTHEWPEDTLPTASRAGVPDGADFDASTLTTPVRRENFTQIFRFDIGVTGTQQALKPRGIKNPYAYHVVNGSHAVVKAIEQRFFDVPDAPGYGGIGQIGAGTVASPRRAKALRELLDASMIVNADSVTINPDLVDQTQELALNAGSKPELLFLAQGCKFDFSKNSRQWQTGTANVQGGVVSNVAAADQRIVRNVDFYQGDGGMLAIVPDRSIDQTAAVNDKVWAWLIQRSKVGLAVVSDRTLKHTPLAKTGDNQKGMILTECTFELFHAKGAAAIKKLVT